MQDTVSGLKFAGDGHLLCPGRRLLSAIAVFTPAIQSDFQLIHLDSKRAPAGAGAWGKGKEERKVMK